MAGAKCNYQKILKYESNIKANQLDFLKGYSPPICTAHTLLIRSYLGNYLSFTLSERHITRGQEFVADVAIRKLNRVSRKRAGIYFSHNVRKLVDSWMMVADINEITSVI